MKTGDLSHLEEILEHRFRNRGLLERALTHSSRANELQSKLATEANGGEENRSPVAADVDVDERTFRDNEQLEFLGDSILGLVTSQLLLDRFPQFREGQLSKLRAHLVSARHLLRIAKQIELGKYLLLGRGEERSGGRHKAALLGDCLEALIAAMYLDSGMEAARKFIVSRILTPELQRIDAEIANGLAFTDYKSALQEWLQSRSGDQPTYTVVSETGPEHKKRFTVEVRVSLSWANVPEQVSRAQGSTKKRAEQRAAQQVLEFLWKHEQPLPVRT